jgi:hypothetical protein
VQWGAWFLIIEPKWTGRGIGQDCVTIFELSQDHAIIPVEAKVDQIQKNIPIVPLEESSSLRCFGYHCSVKIKLTAINFFQSCSTGVLCDRTVDAGECFCFTKG